MNTYFLAGNNPQLSLIELQSLFPSTKFDMHDNFIFGNLNINTEGCARLQNRLGGTLKILMELFTCNKDDVKGKIVEYLQQSGNNSKLRFGLNVYTNKIGTKRLLMDIKKHCGKLRFLNNNFENLSNIVTLKQILNKGGIELNILETEPNCFLIANTLTVQDISRYCERDFSKPIRNMKIGMLPPKLAQILINFAGNPPSIWDPFCGLGVIPIEAINADIKKIYYSDILKEMVIASEKNISWFNNILSNEIKGFTHDVQKYKQIDVYSVITEGYLGERLLEIASKDFIIRMDSIISCIWEKALDNFAQNNIKKVVLCLPCYAGENNEIVFLKKSLEIIKCSKYTQADLSNSERGTLIYRRKGQYVYREIFKLELKN